MRIAVTGAGGFTGRHFADAASAAGHEVLAVRTDLREGEPLAKELSALAPDLVVHLAAISFVGAADARAFYDVNLFGTLNLIDAAKRCGTVRRLLVASSANLYGNNPASPLAETAMPAPVNHYATSKLAMECMARSAAEGLPLVLTRPFNYTGPGQGVNFVVPKLVAHFQSRAPRVLLGNMHVEREYNDVRMVCKAYLELLQESVPPATYNVCTGVTYTLAQLIGKLSDLTGHRLEAQVDPALVRRAEVHRLCGDPSLLRATAGALPAFSIEQTLEWMLSTPQAAGTTA
ncbi:GDP-mannose 4,6-dehydratase [Ramlibacter sp. MMS24-I3-19]|uniref:GDP-mannose 4,6-dehydratase n=1 Tax=Ramlibacter sp. MMS24-I3-19 TaxID=3416606 RepID=UPI003CFF52FE